LILPFGFFVHSANAWKHVGYCSPTFLLSLSNEPNVIPGFVGVFFMFCSLSMLLYKCWPDRQTNKWFLVLLCGVVRLFQVITIPLVARTQYTNILGMQQGAFGTLFNNTAHSEDFLESFDYFPVLNARSFLLWQAGSQMLTMSSIGADQCLALGMWMAFITPVIGHIIDYSYWGHGPLDISMLLIRLLPPIGIFCIWLPFMLWLCHTREELAEYRFRNAEETGNDANISASFVGIGTGTGFSRQMLDMAIDIMETTTVATTGKEAQHNVATSHRPYSSKRFLEVDNSQDAILSWGKKQRQMIRLDGLQAPFKRTPRPTTLASTSPAPPFHSSAVQTISCQSRARDGGGTEGSHASDTIDQDELLDVQISMIDVQGLEEYAAAEMSNALADAQGLSDSSASCATAQDAALSHGKTMLAKLLAALTDVLPPENVSVEVPTAHHMPATIKTATKSGSDCTLLFQSVATTHVIPASTTTITTATNSGLDCTWPSYASFKAAVSEFGKTNGFKTVIKPSGNRSKDGGPYLPYTGHVRCAHKDCTFVIIFASHCDSIHLRNMNQTGCKTCFNHNHRGFGFAF